MKDVIIDLNKIYDNQPNQDWISYSKRPHRNDVISLHQDLAASLTTEVWEAVHYNRLSGKECWEKGWTSLNYFISGERGSGKSTFLHYVTRCIIGKEDPFTALELKPSAEVPTIEMLFFCDPTAMRSNENFFISIIAALRDWLRKQTKTSNMEERRCMKMEASSHQKEQRILDQIKSLAHGIRQLNNGSSSSEAELDPVSQLSIGITNSSNAWKLKREFDALINEVASSYDIDAFLIAIDDADIEFTKNKLIIEIIRTYLTHPRLIIMFTGDTTLTHEAIREKQFGQFDLDFHKADIVNQKRRWELTDAMTAQYIKKIFPPSNHRLLISLYDTVTENKSKYTYKIAYNLHGEQKKEELLPFLERLFARTIEYTPERIRFLIEGFLRLPLRSIMHTLRYWGDRQLFDLLKDLERLSDKIDEQLEKKNDDKEDLEKIHNSIRRSVDFRAKISRLMAESFRSAFHNELLSLGFRKNELEMTNTYQLARGLLLHCFNSKDVSYGHRLATSACRHDNQESTFFLAAKEASMVTHFGHALSYALFGVFSVHAYRYFQQTGVGKNVKLDVATYDNNKIEQYLRHQRQDFIDYLFASNNEDPLRWTRKLSLIFLVHSKNESSQNQTTSPTHLFLSRGVYYLSEKNDIKLLNQILKNQIKRINDPEAKNKWDAFLVYLMLLISCGKASNLQNVYYLSAYNIFGFILQCYNICLEADRAGKDAAGRKEQLTEGLGKILSDFLSAHDIPSWGGAFPRPEEYADIQEQTVNPERGDWKMLIELMADKIIKWYADSLWFAPLYAFELGEEADNIYRTICNTSNALLSETSNDDPLLSATSLLNVFSGLVTHLTDHAEKETNGISLIARLSSFPLCVNSKHFAEQIRNAAQQAERQTLATSSLSFWITSLNRKISSGQNNIESLKEEIENYFVRFRDDDEPIASAKPFLFCNNIEKTIGGSQNIHHYFSRINENLTEMREALLQCTKNGKAIKLSHPDEYIRLKQRIWEQMEIYLSVKADLRVFRRKISNAFQDELKTEIANSQKQFERERKQLQKSLKSLLKKLRRTVSEKTDSPEEVSPEDNVKPAAMKPAAMSSSTRTVMRFYAHWKNNQEDIDSLEIDASEWISDLRDTPYMKNLCKELRLKEEDYTQLFASYESGIISEPSGEHQEIEEIFKTHAEEFADNLESLDEELEQSIDSYKERLAHAIPERRETVRFKMLSDIDKLEKSLYALQNLMTLNIDVEKELKLKLHPNVQADFEAEFALRYAFYSVFITLYSIRRTIELES